MIILKLIYQDIIKSMILKKTLNGLFNLNYTVRFAGSSSERGSNIISEYGYESIKEIKSDGEVRKIFKDIKNKDAIELICFRGGIRTVLLTPAN